MREFYVRCLQPCEVCGGTGLARHTGDEEGVYPCLACDGSGKVNCEVLLSDALGELAAKKVAREGGFYP